MTELYFGMTRARIRELDKNLAAELTEEEFANGWHFCSDWDGLLIHKSHPESEACHCFDEGVENE